MVIINTKESNLSKQRKKKRINGIFYIMLLPKLTYIYDLMVTFSILPCTAIVAFD